MTQTFYNTTDISGDELFEAVRKAANQEQAVWLIYLKSRKSYTVSDVYKMCLSAGHQWIKVSIGRAVTNLFKKGDLVKLEERKVGLYGATEKYYKVNTIKYPIKAQQPSLF